jgi:hypothetical protein
LSTRYWKRAFAATASEFDAKAAGDADGSNASGLPYGGRANDNITRRNAPYNEQLINGAQN